MLEKNRGSAIESVNTWSVSCGIATLISKIKYEIKKYSKTILIKLFYCQILISWFTIYYCYTTRYNIATGCKDRDWILDSHSKIDKFTILDKQNNVFMHYGQCCVLESKQSWISIGKAVERSWQLNIFLEGKAFLTVKNFYFLSVLNNIYFVEYASQHNYF